MKRKHRHPSNRNARVYLIGIPITLVLLVVTVYFYYHSGAHVSIEYGKIVTNQKFYGPAKTNGWHKIDIGFFTIETPKDYRFFKEEAIDGRAGGITNNKDTIWYHFGYYGDFDIADNDVNYLITYKNIDSKQFRIIRHRSEDGFIGMYSRDFRDENAFMFVSDHISAIDTKIRMLETVEIKSR